MNGFAIAKSVGSVVGMVAGSQTVQVIIKSLTPENLSTFEKVAMGIGGTIIGGVVGCACGEYVESVVDDIESISNMFTKESA